MSESELAARAKLKEELKLADVYCRKWLKIITKTGEVLPLVFNSTQKIVYQKIQELKAKQIPIRLVILKSRQQGISTQTQGLIFHDSVTRRHRNSLVMTHEPDSTTSLFEMNKYFYEMLPKLLQPMKRYDNATRLTFDNPQDKGRSARPGIKSQITVATANKKAVGRGITIQNFHASEVAFWSNAEEIMLAVSQAVPRNPDTMIVLESTANGVGGYFYDTYWDAVNGKNDYLPIFLPWYIFPEYSMPAPKDFVPNREELDLIAAYSLNKDQLTWRRWCIANNCGGDINRFKQEYPSSDLEAFIVSGMPLFNLPNLQIYRDNRKMPVFTGSLWSEDTARDVKTPVLQRNGDNLKIYEYPIKGRRYVIGGDTSKGTVHSDYCCLQVLDGDTGDQVAVLRGKIDPTKFAFEAARLGYYYGGAFIGIEVNKDGITTNKVLHQEIKYPRIYRRKQLDNIHEKGQEALGFHTNERTRPAILNTLARWIIEGEFGLHDEATIRECMTFVLDDAGKPQAQEGCHDDTVIALAIATFLFAYTPPAPKKETEFEKVLRERTKERTMSPNW